MKQIKIQTGDVLRKTGESIYYYARWCSRLGDHVSVIVYATDSNGKRKLAPQDELLIPISTADSWVIRKLGAPDWEGLGKYV